MIIMLCLGVAAAFINSVAGGGSILSLPFMIFTGIPTVMAHGTNRFGLVFGSLGSFLDFRKKGQVNLSLIATMLLPVGLGSFFGTLLAVRIPADLLNFILAVVIILLVFNIDYKGHSISKLNLTHSIKFHPALLFFVGFYGGLIQVGAGIVMMYVFSRNSNLSLVQVNALKAAMACCILLISLILFARIGMIHWPLAVSFAIGSYAGGKLGARWQLNKGIGAIKWFVRIMGCVMAVKLILQLL